MVGDCSSSLEIEVVVSGKYFSALLARLRPRQGCGVWARQRLYFGPHRCINGIQEALITAIGVTLLEVDCFASAELKLQTFHLAKDQSPKVPLSHGNTDHNVDELQILDRKSEEEYL